MKNLLGHQIFVSVPSLLIKIQGLTMQKKQYLQNSHLTDNNYSITEQSHI